VMLVKVPKYISCRWEKALGMTEVGRLKINKLKTGKTDMLFNLSADLLKDEANSSTTQSIPLEHRFAVAEIQNQTLAVYSQHIDDSSKIALEGLVEQKAECRPLGDSSYMKLKAESIRKARQPTRVVQQLDKAVVNYKPVSAHRVDIEFEQKRKGQGKKSRDDKEKVQNTLFAAFEKHQYYNLKDLEKITNQPVPYLKEILNEICHYNAKNPHKSMWELKPEFRHYKASESENNNQ